MMTEEALVFLKEKYHGHKIIYVRFSNSEFVFRTLSKKEYKYIKNSSYSEEELQDRICNAACVYPDDYDFEYCPLAGLPEFVSPIIEDESGFGNIDKILSFYHEAKNNTTLEQQSMDMIKAFIPEYTYEEMEEWTWQQLMETTARAERVAGLISKSRGVDYRFELNDKSKEMEEEYNKMNSDNPEFVDNLYNHGIDPMYHFKSELKFENNILDFPLILGTSYSDEVILNAVRRQIGKKKNRTVI